MNDKIAVITKTDSNITPYRVEFPRSIGNYRTLDCALDDIKLFGCKPVFKHG